MTRPIPQELQEPIKALFSKNYSLRAIKEIFPDLSLSLLSRYRMKFFGNSVRPKSGRPSKISTQNMTYIGENLRNGNLDGPRGVQCYPARMGVQMSLRNIRYPLKREGFKAERKVRTKFIHDRRRRGFSDETKVNMWGSDGKSFYWTDRPFQLMPH
ncbi:hypothetical protein MAM1_0021c01825 [Mucor ambiguus]|uniref:Uncharacterized protein n=1 Tax=Mucor ambiguus TaxID=91626 RepID=A0A0C9MH24_9FUNG|nr:hypothetical protein MAM1_0021c01825 [Mucor ambiguus]